MKKFFFLQKICFIIISLLLLNKSKSLLSKATNTQLEPSQEKNGEVGGSVFEDLDIPDEDQSQELNDDSNESGDNAVLADNNFDIFNKEREEEAKEQAIKEAERLAKLKEEEEKRKKEEEEEKRKKEEEEEKKKKEEEEKKEKDEEEKRKKEDEEKKEKEEEEEEEKEKITSINNTISLKTSAPEENTKNQKSLIYKVHNPALDIEKSTKTKIWSISTIIIFGFSYLILRVIYNKLKNINKFFSKCIASLSNQLMFLIICFIIVLLIYTYGNFDSIPLNWEYFISGIAIYIIILYYCQYI